MFAATVPFREQVPGPLLDSIRGTSLPSISKLPAHAYVRDGERIQFTGLGLAILRRALILHGCRPDESIVAGVRTVSDYADLRTALQIAWAWGTLVCSSGPRKGGGGEYARVDTAAAAAWEEGGKSAPNLARLVPLAFWVAGAASVRAGERVLEELNAEQGVSHDAAA